MNGTTRRTRIEGPIADNLALVEAARRRAGGAAQGRTERVRVADGHWVFKLVPATPETPPAPAAGDPA